MLVKLLQPLLGKNHILKLGTGADSGPGVFNDFDFTFQPFFIDLLKKCGAVAILLFCLQLEMVFSSHVTLGIYSLIIEFYWAK